MACKPPRFLALGRCLGPLFGGFSEAKAPDRLGAAAVACFFRSPLQTAPPTLASGFLVMRWQAAHFDSGMSIPEGDALSFGEGRVTSTFNRCPAVRLSPAKVSEILSAIAMVPQAPQVSDGWPRPDGKPVFSATWACCSIRCAAVAGAVMV